jgi:glucose/arabinose dehydrogenase
MGRRRPPRRAAVRRAGAALAAALPLALAACSGTSDGDGDGPTGPAGPSGSSASSSPSSPSGAAAPAARPRVAGVVATGLDAPWGIAFLPDGSALVSERDRARIVRVTAQGDVTDVGPVAGVHGTGEGGLLGIALSPSYPQDSTLFAYYTSGSENVVARLVLDDAYRITDQQTVFDGIPAGPIHNGGRIAFGPDGFLYVGTGEAGRGDPAQDPDDLGGKVLRITPDGDPAPGNPTEGSPVWTLGHRNVQGLAWDARGRMWASEFGQNTWDELNRIVAGDNYGWPEVEGRSGDGDFRDPVRQWHTDVASPSGIAVARGSVFMASLRGERLWQAPLRASSGTDKPRALLTHRYGRLRAVAAAPDGSLWVLTNNTDGRGSPRQGDDRIVRLTFP